MDSYKVYESDAEFYENYLINKELGLINEDNKNDANLKGANVSNNNHKNNHSNNHGNSHSSSLNNKLHDNHKSVFLNQQKFDSYSTKSKYYISHLKFLSKIAPLRARYS